MMSATLIVDVFGNISPIPELVAPDSEFIPDPDNPLDGYLWGVFRPRSELMGWSGGEDQGKPFLWVVHEAELTFHQEESRIGWTQVGLDVGPVVAGSLDPSTPIYVDGPFPKQDRSPAGWSAFPMPDVPSTDPAVAIPPLVQCTTDAIRWFGDTDMSALQVTGIDVSSTKRPHEFQFASVLHWFHAPRSKPHTRAVVTVSADRWNDRMASALADDIGQWNSGSFEFGPLITVPEAHIPRPDMAFTEWSSAVSNLGLPVSMARWDASSIGWIIARIFDLALALDRAPTNLAVRVTRSEAVRPQTADPPRS